MCLVTSDSKHMIIAYTVQVPEQQANLQRTLRTNESFSPGSNLEHTVFVCVDLNVKLSRSMTINLFWNFRKVSFAIPCDLSTIRCAFQVVLT